MKKNTLTLLVIASSTDAKIYDITESDYILIHELQHPQSRLKTSELTSDGQGYYQTDHGTAGKYSPPSDPHKEEHAHFAKIVADLLEKMLHKQHDQRIILCAEPNFYGLLNQAVTKSVERAIVKVIQKDYIPLPTAKLNEVIQNIIDESF